MGNTGDGEAKNTSVVSRQSGEPFDVYIGRGSKWGNPFPMRGRGDAERRRVVLAYESHLLSNPRLLRDLPELQGKVLQCFCAPLPCHGHVLAHYADALSRTGRLPLRTAASVIYPQEKEPSA